MATSTFFEHYRRAQGYDGSPVEMGRSGAATFYKASDLRSGAPVLLTLLPVSSVDPEKREQFEKQARAALKLDHINIAKVVAFGVEDDQFAFVSESPQGDTLDTWVKERGPLSADAVLRVSLQVVSALSAASFYSLTHRAIQPSNLMIVPGQTAEGGWPLVKLMNFGLAGAMSDSLGAGPDSIITEFASPEQVNHGTVDFRSEIYSLGATMCYLLTGIFYSAEPRSFQTRRFARPLRNLITPMLEETPSQRPQDPMLFSQAIRKCLALVERRQNIARKFGIPFAPVVAKPRKRIVAPVPMKAVPPPPPAPMEAPLPVPLAMLPLARVETLRPTTEIPVATHAVRPGARNWHRGLIAAALVLGLATVAVAFLPAPVSLLLHRGDGKQAIGVPVGIPESSPTQVARNDVQNVSPASQPPAWETVAASPAPVQPAEVAAVTAPVNNPLNSAVANPPTVSASPATETSSIADQHPSRASGNVVADNTKNASTDGEPAPPALGPQTVWDRASGTQRKLKIQREDAAQADVASGDAEQNYDKRYQSDSEWKDPNPAVSKPRIRPPVIASESRRPSTSRIAQLPTDHAPRSRTVHARYVGMTPDGNLILRLPSGETTIVSPRSAQRTAPTRRPVRRVVERRTIYLPPPPPYGYGY